MKKNLKFTTIILIFLVPTIIILVTILINDINSKNNYKVHYDRLDYLYSKINVKTIDFKHEILNSINETRDSLMLGEYYDALTRYYILNNNLQKSKIYSDKTMNEYSKIKNADNYILNAFKNASILDIWDPNSNRSLAYYNRMLNIAKKKDIISNSNFTKEDIQGLTYSMLSIFYCKSNNFNKVNEYLNLLNNLNNKNIQDKEIGYIINFAKGIYNICYGDIKKAEKDLLLLSNQLDNEPMNLMYIKSTAYLNTSIVQILNGDFKNALIGIDKTVKLNKNIKNNILIECHIAYGFYYDRQNIFEKAKANYEQALNISEETANNIGAIRSVGSLIALSQKSNKSIDNEIHYKKFWDLSNVRENSIQSYINNMIDLNNKLSNERLSIVENERTLETEKHKILNLALIISIVALILLSLSVHRLCCEVKVRKESELKLKKIINEDYLTKASTRSYAYNKLKHMVEAKDSIYLAMVDLDNFKKINDNFGHDIGDKVLVNFVQICNCFITNKDFVARFGGEEFLILLKDKTKENAIEIIENISQSLENKDWDIDGLRVTVSIGLVYNKYENVDMLIKKADELLYIAKKAGKNKVQM
ncbi:tetratricopeptide repeat-containing diguanylate cyclase [Clostridium lundense]|uniref:tetratricopeptide repeat-containing diguanylate cyclase n=1 Tax=Clostridium lundense TaxID=319475 RepID=UPI00048656D7|nr:GGDEF domain-containing protein [Clostridium lundense]